MSVVWMFLLLIVWSLIVVALIFNLFMVCCEPFLSW